MSLTWKGLIFVPWQGSSAALGFPGAIGAVANTNGMLSPESGDSPDKLYAETFIITVESGKFGSKSVCTRGRSIGTVKVRVGALTKSTFSNLPSRNFT